MGSGHLDLLLLAAFQPELAPLELLLGQAMRGRVGKAVVEARVVGIGLPMAAVGAAMHLGDLKPRAALLIGTCGAYVGSGFSIGEVVVARQVRLIDPSALEGCSQFPGRMSVAAGAHKLILESIMQATGARPADVATTLAITVEDATAGRIESVTGMQVEHLEAHAVATACAAKGVPFGAVLAIANFVGARARDEWRRHHRKAASSAANAVLKWLAGGGISGLRSLRHIPDFVPLRERRFPSRPRAR